MPFKSEAQRRFMYSQHPKIAKKWEKKTEKKKLPERVSKKKKSKSESFDNKLESILENVGEGTLKTYYKALPVPRDRHTGKPPRFINIKPGYMTDDPEVVNNYLSVWMLYDLEPDEQAWIIKANIDTSLLEPLDTLINGPAYDDILPGYHGEAYPDEGIKTPLSVIVWNENIRAEVVGAYIVGKNVNHDIEPGQEKSWDQLIDSGNAWRSDYNWDDWDDFE